MYLLVGRMRGPPARLWLDDGKPTKARELLASSYDWFTEGLDAPVLKRAKALLGALKT